MKRRRKKKWSQELITSHGPFTIQNPSFHSWMANWLWNCRISIIFCWFFFSCLSLVFSNMWNCRKKCKSKIPVGTGQFSSSHICIIFFSFFLFFIESILDCNAHAVNTIFYWNRNVCNVCCIFVAVVILFLLLFFNRFILVHSCLTNSISQFEWNITPFHIYVYRKCV